MMNVEMVCGHCTSQILLECEEDDSTPVWLMVYRFADSHVSCGYVTAVHKDAEAEPEASGEV